VVATGKKEKKRGNWKQLLKANPRLIGNLSRHTVGVENKKESGWGGIVKTKEREGDERKRGGLEALPRNLQHLATLPGIKPEYLANKNKKTRDKGSGHLNWRVRKRSETMKDTNAQSSQDNDVSGSSDQYEVGEKNKANTPLMLGRGMIETPRNGCR